MSRLDALINEINRSQFVDPEQLKALCVEGCALAREASDMDALVRCLGSLAYAEQVAGNFASAFEHIVLSFEAAGANDTLRCATLLRLGSLLSDMGCDPAALLACAWVERHWTERTDKSLLMRAHVSMSTSYLRLDDPERALERLGLAMKIADELGDEKTMYWCIHSTGIAQQKKGSHAKAIETFQRVLPYYWESAQHYNYAAVHMLLGESYLVLNPARAKYHLELAQQIATEHHFELLTVQTLILLAQYQRLQHDPATALESLSQAVESVSAKESSGKATTLLHFALSRHYEETGDLKKALYYARKAAEQHTT